MANTPAHLQFQSSGVPGTPAIVLIHGGGAGSWMWKKVMASLPQYYCLAPDLPEHGQSREIGPFSIELAARLVAELIRDQIPNQKATVVGLSEGAQVLVAMLSRHPDVIDKAIVSSALTQQIPGTGLLTPTLLSWSYRWAMAPFRNNDFWIRLNMKYSAGLPEEYFPEFKKEFQQMTESGFINLMNANLHFTLPPGLDLVTVPTLVVAGKREYHAMRSSARNLAAALGNAQACQLDLGQQSSLAQEHNWALTAPTLFAQTVQAWITGIPLPAQLTPLDPS